MEADVSQPLRARRFVGRSSELELLLSSLDGGSAEGLARFAFIEGPAGIGKTRLLDEALRSSLTRRFVVKARHSDSVRGPYLGLHLAFERAAQRAPDAIKPLVQESANLLSADSDLEKPRRFAAVARALLRMVSLMELLIVIDDAQWADRATLDLMRFLRVELAHEPLAIALLSRAPSAEAMPDVLPDALTLRLRPLTPESVQLLLQDVSTRSRLSEADREAITHLANGNPLLALELARHRSAGKDLFPRSITAPIEQRLRSLSAAEQTVIEIAAIAEEPDIDLLAAVSGQATDAVTAALRSAETAGLLVSDGGIWRFEHNLARETIVAAIAPGKLLPIHRSIAECLEIAPERNAARLAHHWLLAGNRERAGTYSAEAGIRSTEVGAHNDAIPHLRRAVELGCTSQAQRARLYELLGFAYLVASRFAEAAHAFDKATSDYLATENDEGVIRIALNRSRLAFSQAEMAQMHAAASAATALVELRAPSALGFRAWSHVAQNHLYDGSFVEARRALDEGARHRAFAADADLTAYEVVTARVALHFGEIQRFREHADLAVTAADRVPRIEVRTAVLHNLGVYAAYSGLAGEGRSFLERSLELSTEYRLHFHAAMTQLDIARLDWLEAKLTSAANRVRACFEGASQFSYTKLYLLAYGLPIALTCGDHELLARCKTIASFEDALDSTNDEIITSVGMALAHWHYFDNRFDEARNILSRAFCALRSAVLPPLFGTWLAIAGHYEEFGPALERLDGDVRLAAVADRAQLEAASGRRRGRFRVAVTKARSAADIYKQLGWPLWQAHALCLANRQKAAAAIVRETGANVWFNTEEPALHRLTPRERDVVERAASGKSNRQIAAELDLSTRTVENYLQAVFSRFGITSRTELADALRAQINLP